MISLLLLMAGASNRCSFEYKQFKKIKDKYLFEYSLSTFLQISEIENILLVVDQKHYDLLANFIKINNLTKCHCVIGGTTRQKSVFNGLKYLKNLNPDFVMIHDSARPLISKEIILNHIKKTTSSKAILTYINEIDSIAKIEKETLKQYENRDTIIKIQTPQTFQFDLLYSLLKENKINYNDEGIIFNKKNIPISLIKGNEYNFKVTFDFDFLILESLINYDKQI